MRIMKIMKAIGVIAVGLLVLPIVAGLSLRAMRDDVPVPGKLYDVGGFKMHINCTGSKNDRPTVIFATGLGVSSPRYYWLMEALSSSVQVCIYDRAGMGWSDRSNAPYSAELVPEQLHTLLEKAGIEGPFILAGHSFGGLVIRGYAKKYPDDVVGLAFLDSSHPDQTEALNIDIAQLMTGPTKLRKIFTVLGLTEFFPGGPKVSAELPARIIAQQNYLRQSPNIPAAMLDEVGQFEELGKLAKLPRGLGDMPIVVITAGSTQIYPTEEENKKFRAAWSELQAQTASLSTRGRGVTIEGADHMSLAISQKFTAQVAEEIMKVVVQSASEHDPNTSQ